MGHWDETCAITGLPVLDGNRIMMIVPRETPGLVPSTGLSSLMEKPGHYRSGVSVIAKGRYNGYGWIDKAEIIVGEMPPIEPSRPYLRSVFIFTDVWDEIQRFERFKPEWETDLETKVIDDEMRVIDRDAQVAIIKLLAFAYRARINIDAAKLFKGAQVCIDGEFEDRMDILMDMRSRKYEEIIDAMSDDDEEAWPWIADSF